MADDAKENQADPQVHPALETKVLNMAYEYFSVLTIKSFQSYYIKTLFITTLGTVSLSYCSKF